MIAFWPQIKWSLTIIKENLHNFHYLGVGEEHSKGCSMPIKANWLSRADRIEEEDSEFNGS